MDWSQQRILITGGAGGLGLASALYLLFQGAKVILLDSQEDKLEQARAALEKQGLPLANLQTISADITQESAVEQAFAQIKLQSCPLTALVQCAGVLQDGLLVKANGQNIEAKLSLAQWQKVVDVNLTGSFLCGREAASLMIEQGQGGAIINVSSVAQTGNIGQSNYAATKAGVSALVVCWAKELARYHIRVAGIAPGVFATEMTRALQTKAMDRLLQLIPLKQLGQGEHFAHAIGFILQNPYFTGRILELDGGLRM